MLNPMYVHVNGSAVAGSVTGMPQGPDRASFFPAIVKKHGQPMEYWFEVMADLADRTYPEQMAFLRENHGFSQAHANALIMYSRGSTSSRRFTTLEGYLETQDETRKATTKRILSTITKAFPETEVVIAWNKPLVKLGKHYIFGVSSAGDYLLIAPFDAEVIHEFAPRLAAYKVNKKTIQVPGDWKVDKTLLTDMVAACIQRITD